MYAFLDAHHETYGVEPICRVLQIAPSGYYRHRTRTADCRRGTPLGPRPA
jgi:putative transposase